MKKTESRSAKRAQSQGTSNPEVDAQAVHVLSTVSDDKAFYFYEAVGKPTGQTARNLRELLENVKTADPQTLMFHHARKDFQNWTEKVLGDAKLARKLEQINARSGEQVKTEIRKAVEARLRQLAQTSTQIIVDESVAVLPISP
jgi:tryptophan 2,3-dioxygenase